MDNYTRRPIEQYHSTRTNDVYQEEYTTSPNSTKRLALDSYQTSSSGLDAYQSSGISDPKSRKTDGLSDSEVKSRGDRHNSTEINHANQEQLHHGAFQQRDPKPPSYNLPSKESLESYYSHGSQPVFDSERHSRHSEQHYDTNMKSMNGFRHCYQDMDQYQYDMRTSHESGPRHHDKSPGHDMSYSNHSMKGDYHHFRSRNRFPHPKNFGGRYNQKNHGPRFERFKNRNHNSSLPHSYQNGRPTHFNEKNAPGFGNDVSKMKQNNKPMEKFPTSDDDHTPVFGTNFSLNQVEKIPQSETRANSKPYFRRRNQQERPGLQQVRGPYPENFAKNISTPYVHKNDEHLPAIVDEIVRRQNSVGQFQGIPEREDYSLGFNNNNTSDAQTVCEVKADSYETSPSSHVRNGEISAKKEISGVRLDEYQTSAKSD